MSTTLEDNSRFCNNCEALAFRFNVSILRSSKIVASRLDLLCRHFRERTAKIATMITNEIAPTDDQRMTLLEELGVE